jgi:hypothetical protein
MIRTKRAFGVLAALALVAPCLQAQNPLGGELVLNQFTSSSQSAPQAAGLNGGSFLVTWQSSTADGDDLGIALRMFDSAGAPLGNEMVVNTTTASAQATPAIAATAGGDFVVVWRSPDGDGDGIYGQRFDSSRAAVGDQFRVNDATASTQTDPSVAIADDGSFLVVWTGFGIDGSSTGVAARLFDSTGAALTGDVVVNSSTLLAQSAARAVTLANDNFMVVWEGSDGSITGIFGQRLLAGGAKTGAELPINEFTPGAQAAPAVAASSTGFIVTWESNQQDGDGRGVFARMFDNAGAALSGEILVNSVTTGSQTGPRVLGLPNGDAVIAWTDPTRDGSGSGVYGRLLPRSGAPVGEDFQLHTTEVGSQSSPTMALSGSFVAAWTAENVDGASTGIAAQRFGLPPVVSVTMDKALFAQTDTADLTVTYSAGDSSDPVDVWLVLMLPDGSFVFGDGWSSDIDQWRQDFTPADEVEVIVDDVPVAGIAAGTYTWFAGTTEPDTFDLAGPTSIFVWTVQP